ncbi:MAG: hypothetical protein MMC33_007213 [Icmadophila ericetorum]|nr:hypothetical protein [Icmadophila ericetorum]
MDSLLSLYWVLPLIFFSYCGLDLLIARSLVRKYCTYPLVSSPSAIAPRFILNLIFAGKAAQVLEEGYRKVTRRISRFKPIYLLTSVKFKARAFHFIRGDGSVVVLPISLLDELSSLPPSVASPNGALEHDLLGQYTGLNLILESKIHHSIVQRKLTPRLGVLTLSLEDELKSAFEDYFPACEGWTEFMPYQTFGKISARLSGRALVGTAYCRNPTWLDISFNYAESLFRTVVILRLFPDWIRPLLCRVLPSFWHDQRYVRLAKALLGPKIRGLLRRNSEGSLSPTDNEDDSNVLSWLVDKAKGRDRDPDTLAHVKVS